MTVKSSKYLIKNGKVFRNNFTSCEKLDIRIEGGTITEIAPMIRETTGMQVINAEGLLLSGGWIDSHVHVYEHKGEIGVSADSMLKTGVTAVVDAGTTGACNFSELQSIINSSNIQIKSYLHIGKWGISGSHGELLDMESIDSQACIDTCERYPDEIIGLKVRIDPRVCINEEQALQKLRDIGDKTGKRIVVHASRSSLSLERILSYFGEGDIFAHSYADKSPGLLDKDGMVKAAAWEAKHRGVIFDLSHGNGNFSFPIARKAMEQGFLIDTISTDIHSGSIGRVGDMATVMTKLSLLGMSQEEILRRVTAAPAAIMGLTDYAPELTVGQKANVTAFSLEQGEYHLFDCEMNEEISKVRFRTKFTIRNERLEFLVSSVYPNDIRASE